MIIGPIGWTSEMIAWHEREYMGKAFRDLLIEFTETFHRLSSGVLYRDRRSAR